MIDNTNTDTNNKKTIEEKLNELEATISALEGDDLPLESAFSLYEKGMKMVAECEKEIDTVEKKVLMLSGGKIDEFQ